MADNKPDKTKHIAIFASGAGSNAAKMTEYFAKNSSAIISVIVCNKPGAGVLQIAHQHNIETIFLEKEKFFKGNAYINELQDKKIDFIVLAGFLWKIPSRLIEAYKNKIINIHPALLPKYGGKGMYGHFVHEAVIAAHEKKSGITIHLVDELYDHGKTIFQATCEVFPNDTPNTLAQRIHKLEHENFAKVVEAYINSFNS